MLGLQEDPHVAQGQIGKSGDELLLSVVRRWRS